MSDMKPKLYPNLTFQVSVKRLLAAVDSIGRKNIIFDFPETLNREMKQVQLEFFTVFKNCNCNVIQKKFIEGSSVQIEEHFLML